MSVFTRILLAITVWCTFLYSVVDARCHITLLVPQLPEKEPVTLIAAARIENDRIDESSGIVASPSDTGCFWTHNDSGDDPLIFAINATGKDITPKARSTYQGIHIADAVNIDWEDIAVNEKGNLVIGAFGNNANARRDLALYEIREPNPRFYTKTRIYAKYNFAWPNQEAFPPRTQEKNFDCEALFCAYGNAYLLTKHRGNTHTMLYKFHTLHENELNIPACIGHFAANGQVTAADATRDGNKLALLTYNAVWCFTAPEGSDDYFHGTIAWLPIHARQCEGICFKNDSQLLITNEQRDIYIVDVNDLIFINASQRSPL